MSIQDEIDQNALAVEAAAADLDKAERAAAEAIQARSGKESDSLTLDVVEQANVIVRASRQALVTLKQHGQRLSGDLAAEAHRAKQELQRKRLDYVRSRIDDADQRLQDAVVEVRALNALRNHQVDLARMLLGKVITDRVKAREAEMLGEIDG